MFSGRKENEKHADWKSGFHSKRLSDELMFFGNIEKCSFFLFFSFFLFVLRPVMLKMLRNATSTCSDHLMM